MHLLKLFRCIGSQNAKNRPEQHQDGFLILGNFVSELSFRTSSGFSARGTVPFPGRLPDLFRSLLMLHSYYSFQVLWSTRALRATAAEQRSVLACAKRSCGRSNLC